MEKETRARAQAIDIRRLVIALAAVLAAATVWAGVSLASGSGESQQPSGNAPAQSERDGVSFSQDGSNRPDGRGCPEKEGGGEPPGSDGAADASV